MNSIIFNIRHTSTYAYHNPVSVSHHLLKLKPRGTGRQRLLRHSYSIAPEPKQITPHTDYFGNQTHFMSVQGTHQSLEVVSDSRVEVFAPYTPDPGETPPWELVAGLCLGERAWKAVDATEFVYDSALIQCAPEYGEYARVSFPAGRPILQGVMDLLGRIYRDFKFDPTATHVATPLAEVFQKRRGVCQDFAHFMVAGLRSIGLPARYVSGYLETLPPPGQAKLVGADASHAWVSVFCPGLGWIDVDPTNNMAPGMRHITVGWGRDFSDVSPLRGVILGNGAHTLQVSVDVNPEPAAPPSAAQPGAGSAPVGA